ncbi:MAG: hypothetical protein Q9211_004819 [Gyalolechia sp. 1 TL-2023]
MAFIISNPQLRTLPHLEDHPEQLARERDQRYVEPPPPYPSSGETTQPPGSEEPPVIDEYARWVRWRKERFQSTPLEQFRSQSRREEKRLDYQRLEGRSGRRQTLPFDETLDYQANAENNIRSGWVEQGIWVDEWGPPWPPGTELWGMPGPEGPKPSGYWAHEAGFKTKPQTEPQPQPRYNIFATESKPEDQPKPPQESAARPQRNTSASRPYYQFLSQVAKETEWLKDELLYQRRSGTIDVEARAYEDIKDIWIKEKIWNPKWGELPGMTWMHEEPDPERPKTPEGHKELDRLFGLSSGVARDGEHERPVTSPQTRTPEPTLDLETDGIQNLFAPVPNEVKTSGRVTTGPTNRRNRTLRAVRPIRETSQSPEQSADRTLRGVRSSKVVKRKESNSNATKRRPGKPNDRSIESSQTSNSARNNGTVLEPLDHNDDNVDSTSIRQRTSSPRSTRRGRPPSLGLVKPSGVSKPKTKRKGRPRTERPSVRPPNSAAEPNHALTKSPSQDALGAPRRSSRIAEQLRTKEEQWRSKQPSSLEDIVQGSVRPKAPFRKAQKYPQAGKRQRVAPENVSRRGMGKGRQKKRS